MNHPSLKKRMSWFGVCAVLVLLLSANAEAQTPPWDFSDAESALVQWPFEVIEYFVEVDNSNIFQHSRVKESPLQVYEAMKELKANHSTISGLTVSGIGQNPEPNSYVVTFTKGNNRFQVNIKPDGSGAEIVVRATPRATVSGYFKHAIYPYRLGGDTFVGSQRYDFMDE